MRSTVILWETDTDEADCFLETGEVPKNPFNGSKTHSIEVKNHNTRETLHTLYFVPTEKPKPEVLEKDDLLPKSSLIGIPESWEEHVVITVIMARSEIIFVVHNEVIAPSNLYRMYLSDEDPAILFLAFSGKPTK